MLVSLLLLGATASCTGRAVPAPDTRQLAEPALASYTPPAEAPAFCSVLAHAGSVSRLAPALGQLITDPWNLPATRELADARSDMEKVIAAVPREQASAPIATSLRQLLDNLDSVADTGVTAVSSERIRTDLQTLGRLTQPVCDYPT